ncbi:uncharacterized protein [Anabrus simplex]
MSNCQEWCRWLFCCKCFLKSKTDGTGLLPGKTADDVTPKSAHYYTVRRISRVGYASSREDINDSCSDLGATGEPMGACPVDTWTEPVQPGVGRTELDVLDVPLERQKGRWHSALHVLQPKRSRSKERRKFNVPVITLSSPDIVQDLKKESKHVYLNPKKTNSGRLDYSVVTDQTTISSLSSQHDQWSRSQSMENIKSSITPISEQKEISNEDNSDTDSTLLARTCGLEKSLYVQSDSSYKRLTESKSTDTLQSLWQPAKQNTDGCFIEQPHGSVEFSAFYNQKNKKLLIHISKVSNLPPKGRGDVYDVIIKLAVLPNEKNTKTTQVLKGSRSPAVGEDFHFTVKEPAGKLLRISVFNAEAQGKYDAVGNALFNMEDVIAGKPRNYSMKLYKQTQPDVCPGNIQVCLRYQRQENVLSVLVTQASNLSICNATKKNKHNDKYNTFVKVAFFCSGQKIKSRKSNPALSDRNPQYNYSTEFRVPPEYSEDCYIVISIQTKGLLRKELAVGRVVLGPHFYAEGQNLTPWGQTFLKGESVSHWFRMYL